MRKSEAHKSRRKTPWDGEESMTPLQAFLKEHYDERYQSHHKKLVKKLELESIVHASSDTKGLLDKDNPLYPVNRAHAILKMFLNSHSGFLRKDMQGYLNLFALVTNPPHEMLSKVENVKSWHLKIPNHYVIEIFMRQILISNESITPLCK